MKTSGKPTKVLRREDGHDQMHGRGWTGRSRHRLIPAPAVTYVGEVKLPAMLSIALVPLAAGQELAEIPRIESATSGETTTWRLPGGDGALRFATSPERCEVLE